MPEPMLCMAWNPLVVHMNTCEKAYTCRGMHATVRMQVAGKFNSVLSFPVTLSLCETVIDPKAWKRTLKLRLHYRKYLRLANCDSVSHDTTTDHTSTHICDNNWPKIKSCLPCLRQMSFYKKRSNPCPPEIVMNLITKVSKSFQKLIDYINCSNAFSSYLYSDGTMQSIVCDFLYKHIETVHGYRLMITHYKLIYHGNIAY